MHVIIVSIREPPHFLSLELVHPAETLQLPNLYCAAYKPGRHLAEGP